jgi:hypothetical protein
MRIDLEPSDLNVVMDMLSQGPFRAVAPVIQKIQMQVMTQQQPVSQSDAAQQDTVSGGTD